jgi:pimeloyl-ACP methyl ester carboxylesterase
MRMASDSRPLWRWTKRIGLGTVALAALIVAGGATWEALGKGAAARDYPPPGKLVDIGGRKIHVDCRGQGSPTVIFESGLGSGGSLDWSLVHDEIARTTRACAYDRAGIMWSDPKSTPQDGVAVARDLHAALDAAHVDGPLVMVGHSVGGPYITTFASLYGDRVAGLVYVDGSRPGQEDRLGALIHKNMHPSQVAWIAHAARDLAWSGLVRWYASRPSPTPLPARIKAEMAAYGSNSINGASSEVDGFDRTMAEAAKVHSLGDRPMVVLTAMKPMSAKELKGMKLTPQQGAAFKQLWKTLHDEQLTMSTRSSEQTVPDSGHYIQIERPDVVIAAVKEVVATVHGDTARPVG